MTMVQRYLLGRSLIVGVVLLVCSPFILCARAVVKYTPTETSASLPACTTCDVCRSHDEDLKQNMAAYREGVHHGQLGDFREYVTDLCLGTPQCFEAFDELREKYEAERAAAME